MVHKTFFLFFATLMGIPTAYETAKYTVLQTLEPKVEIREYNALLLATVSSPNQKERNKSFRTLFRYISGKNTNNQEIAMTTPVFQENWSGEHKMSFVMPNTFDSDNLPRPVENEVSVEAVPKKTFIAIRFSGRATEKNFAKRKEILEVVIRENKIPADLSQPIYAYYNSPWTLPFLKRNEVLFPIKNQ